MKKLIIFVHIFSNALLFLPQRPEVFVHGLGDNCEKFEQTDLFICLETGKERASSNNIRTQAKLGCELLTNLIFDEKGVIKKKFQYGFYLRAYSQGGIIARLILKICPNILKNVAVFLTAGTPHLGIDSLPKIEDLGMTLNGFTKPLVKMLRWIFQSWVQLNNKERGTSIFQYLNPKDKKHKAKLIEELLYDSSYDFSDLELCVNISFANDKLIFPRTSQTFGLEFDEDNQKWKNFNQFPHHASLGLGLLWDTHRLWNCRSQGGHLAFTEYERSGEDTILSDLCDKYEIQPSVAETKKLYRKCTWEKMMKYYQEFLNCDQLNFINDQGILKILNSYGETENIYQKFKEKQKKESEERQIQIQKKKGNARELPQKARYQNQKKEKINLDDDSPVIENEILNNFSPKSISLVNKKEPFYNSEINFKGGFIEDQDHSDFNDFSNSPLIDNPNLTKIDSDSIKILMTENSFEEDLVSNIYDSEYEKMREQFMKLKI